MVLKNNKGITLVALVITVIILAILSYVTITLSINISGVAKFQDIETYMLLIQTKCATLANEMVVENLDEGSLYGKLQTER